MPGDDTNNYSNCTTTDSSSGRRSTRRISDCEIMQLWDLSLQYTAVTSAPTSSYMKHNNQHRNKFHEDKGFRWQDRHNSHCEITQRSVLVSRTTLQHEAYKNVQLNKKNQKSYQLLDAIISYQQQSHTAVQNCGRWGHVHLQSLSRL